MQKMIVKSVTLRELGEKIQKTLKEHPEWADTMVYFDALHICGWFDKSGDYLEMR